MQDAVVDKLEAKAVVEADVADVTAFEVRLLVLGVGLLQLRIRSVKSLCHMTKEDGCSEIMSREGIILQQSKHACNAF